MESTYNKIYYIGELLCVSVRISTEPFARVSSEQPTIDKEVRALATVGRKMSQTNNEMPRGGDGELNVPRLVAQAKTNKDTEH